MDQTRQLAEQHILESRSRLKHVDELMARAKAAHAQAAQAAGLATAMAQTQQHRDRLAQHLTEVQGQPAESTPRWVKLGETLHADLEAAGLQLEKVLTAVLR